MARKRLRDIIILLPGITGSVLQRNGKDLWAISGSAAWHWLSSLGKALDHLLLKKDDQDVDDLGDGIVATRLMPDAHLVPGLVKIDGYSKIVSAINDNFKIEPGNINEPGKPANYFEFPYDWRRDNRVAARRLRTLIDRQLPLWRERSGASDARVILIAHSMGGLIARHYLEVLDGWTNCKALITFGTPYRGSLNVLDFLANGYKKLFVDLTDVMRSFTSVYQLLPIYKALKVGGEYHRVAEIEGIPFVDKERAKQALAFHREIENAVNRHRKDPEYLEKGYKIIPVLGTRQPTLQSAELSEGRLTAKRDLPDWIDDLLGDGDGTVPRLSAIPIELSDEYRDTFFPERHGSLQANDSVLYDIRSRLEQMQIVGLHEIRGPLFSEEAAQEAALSLELDDLYVAGEMVELRAQLINVREDAGGVEALLESISHDGVKSVKKRFQAADGNWLLQLEGLQPGLYRVAVQTSRIGPAAPPPVHDIFEIAKRPH
jgi:pimeloyl-ACP methyl ester carboxylesterase